MKCIIALSLVLVICIFSITACTEEGTISEGNLNPAAGNSAEDGSDGNAAGAAGEAPQISDANEIDPDTPVSDGDPDTPAESPIFPNDKSSDSTTGDATGELEIICTTPLTDIIELKIINNSSSDWGFGLEPYFQRLTDGEWTDVPLITDIAIPEICCMLPAGGGYNTKVMEISEWYGTLSEGNYRAGVKLSGEAGEQMLWYEFEIDTIID